MSDYSLELASERIPDARTRRYFSEVMVSYSCGCYRSAIVMLWSVAICDILFKLVQLAEQYGDTIAKGILKDIEVIRLANPNSPEWEWKLVAEVKTRTQLLETGDYANLDALQKHRHLSAHPVLSASEVLFEPNKETARAHIRNTLEGVLTKPAIMTKKVFDMFVEDIEASAVVLPDKPGLTKYLVAKYFSHMSPISEQAIFRGLWRLVFRSEDARCEANRAINFRALAILYERRKEAVRTAIGAERDYYSDVGLQDSRFDSFLRFVGMHPELYALFTDAAKTPLETTARMNLSNFSRAWFLSPDVIQHLQAIEKQITQGRFISSEAFEELLEASIAAGADAKAKALDIAITQFGVSSAYDMADSNFILLIKPFLQRFSKVQLINLAKAIDGNGQIYGRGRAAAHHRLIKDVLDAVFADGFDYAAYPRFAESVGIEIKKLPKTEPDDDITF